MRNAADQMVYQSEKTLSDAGDKVSEEEKKPVQEKIDALKEALKGEDVDKIKAAQEELQKSLFAIAEKLYANAAPQGAEGADAAGAQPGPDGNNVYEADYKDVDEKDKK